MLGDVGCEIEYQAEVDGGQFAYSKFRDSRVHVMLINSFYTFKIGIGWRANLVCANCVILHRIIKGKLVPKRARHFLF